MTFQKAFKWHSRWDELRSPALSTNCGQAGASMFAIFLRS